VANVQYNITTINAMILYSDMIFWYITYYSDIIDMISILINDSIEILLLWYLLYHDITIYLLIPWLLCVILLIFYILLLLLNVYWL